MSRERIQEHFTDLYEGTLDPGLAQQIARRFESDAELKADYAEFAKTMDLLAMMPEESVEVPSYLSARIAEKLDAAQSKQTSSLLSGVWLRNFSFGALGLVAIVSGFLALRGSGDGPVQASMTGGKPAAVRKNLDVLELKMVNNQPALTYVSSGPKTVTVRSEGGKQVIKTFELSGNPMECPLENKEAAPAVFEVEATGDTMKHVFIVPGSSKDYEAKGEGALIDFLKVVSVKYDKTIHLQLSPSRATAAMKWDITNALAQNAVSDVLPSAEYSVSVARDGVLSVSAHN